MVISGQFPHFTFTLGLVGNIVLLMVFLSPLPTFIDVYKEKTTKEFQSTPYVVGLFSSMLWIYYVLLKGDAMLMMITIRYIGMVLQICYVCVFVFYAKKRAKMECLKLIIVFIVIGFGLIVFLTQFLTKGAQRDVVVGWVFLVLSSLCVFVAPLAILRQVVKTKRVEFMPILLSFSVALNNVTWFFYGFLIGDFNIVIPNALGFTLGIIQFIFYYVYKSKKPVIDEKTIETKKAMNDVDEPSAPKVNDQTTIDMVEPNVYIHDENAQVSNGVPVVHSPLVANHAIDIPA